MRFGRQRRITVACSSLAFWSIVLSGVVHVADAAGENVPRSIRALDATFSPAIRDFRLDYDYIHAPQRHARSAGAATSEVRRNFFYIQDTDGELVLPISTDLEVLALTQFALREFYRIAPDEFTFVIIFTAFPMEFDPCFYHPEANDLQGIGD